MPGESRSPPRRAASWWARASRGAAVGRPGMSTLLAVVPRVQPAWRRAAQSMRGGGRTRRGAGVGPAPLTTSRSSLADRGPRQSLRKRAVRPGDKKEVSLDEAAGAASSREALTEPTSSARQDAPARALQLNSDLAIAKRASTSRNPVRLRGRAGLTGSSRADVGPWLASHEL